jgi:hypothetical protein
MKNVSSFIFLFVLCAVPFYILVGTIIDKNSIIDLGWFGAIVCVKNSTAAAASAASAAASNLCSIGTLT